MTERSDYLPTVWKLKLEEIFSGQVSSDKLWYDFVYVFSESSKKRSAYKYGLIKAFRDNLFNMTLHGRDYFISYLLGECFKIY